MDDGAKPSSTVITTLYRVRNKVPIWIMHECTVRMIRGFLTNMLIKGYKPQKVKSFGLCFNPVQKGMPWVASNCTPSVINPRCSKYEHVSVCECVRVDAKCQTVAGQHLTWLVSLWRNFTLCGQRVSDWLLSSQPPHIYMYTELPSTLHLLLSHSLSLFSPVPDMHYSLYCKNVLFSFHFC